LSRYLSYVLRHDPSTLGLSLDPEGFVSLPQLLSAMKRQKKWNWVKRGHVKEIVETSNKKRFEIADNRIRALYGHTVPLEVRYENVVPPAFLYHGTSEAKLESIMESGLKPMRRHYVHLSTTCEDARDVGLRKNAHPMIIRVLALEAHRNGIKFYKAGEVFLSEFIPSSFLQIESNSARRTF